MGDISIIARRLSDKYVQHGWSGNGGYFRTVGSRLYHQYNDPAMVEYLFGLGQLRLLWDPYSEEGNNRLRTIPDGMPHWVHTSEQWIFSEIAFIDYGYFYDSDNTWYYVIPGAFRIKMPLTLVGQNLDASGFEFDFTQKVQEQVFYKLMNMCRNDPAILERLKETQYDEKALNLMEKELAHISEGRELLYELWRHHRPVFDCFDDWVLVRADESGESIGEIVAKPKEDKHIETIFW